MGYLGSKAASGAYQVIISQMPPHDTYIETHLGSGAVMFHKPPAARTIGIDVDSNAFLLTRGRWREKGLTPPKLNLYHGDAVGFLQRELEGGWFGKHGRVLIYADPPYLPETRTSRARYRHEYTVDDHRRLIATLRAMPASVMISGYPSQLYDELLGNWRSLEFQVMTRGGPRTEKLWMNYTHDAAYSAAFAGTDYIDRQRIKRKAERWAAKYRDLPPGEQLAILTEMLKDNS
ncbi:DNA adenine methylase [Serratia marcescens]|uniref:DNA adenine methylase n=1 Tax=Serratia marcescens TaxID=615 RepID=UPI002177A8E7|nr:DNA adenine methylase [Serratia marcescens]MCW6014549.1 DNA adenine methylase [Serratia marcescens]CAI0722757.1 Site-specific DNA methylase [Serratia marcescens]CAI0875553.1 Site-specific DNA methylase [Serratia marcescens]